VAHTILVVGGAGAFGSLLVDGLIAATDLDVIIGGRDLTRAEARAAAAGTSRAQALRLDTATVTEEALHATGALVVVDAAGPFQGADYRLARAAIAAGLHYVDLADARDFVAGFGALDPEARAAGVVALTGASSTPALSNAVLDRLTSGWRQIDTIEIAISPGNRNSPRGLSVTQAILSYVGRPVRVFAGGGWQSRPGAANAAMATVSPQIDVTFPLIGQLIHYRGWLASNRREERLWRRVSILSRRMKPCRSRPM
jgi:saccharopine dehydrogenase-like NADP-dependent oxidoreductase